VFPIEQVMSDWLVIGLNDKLLPVVVKKRYRTSTIDRIPKAWKLPIIRAKRFSIWAFIF